MESEEAQEIEVRRGELVVVEHGHLPCPKSKCQHINCLGNQFCMGVRVPGADLMLAGVPDAAISIRPMTTV